MKANAETSAPAKVRGKGGRPTPEDVRRRDARIVGVATDIFIRKGYSATTIDEIAATANVAKRTLYRQYPNKGELFAAVVRWRVAEVFDPSVNLVDDHKTVDDALLQLAVDVVQICTDSDTAQISRLLVSESVRFPELALLTMIDGTKELVRNVSVVLQRLAEQSDYRLRDTPEREATRFCDLMVGMSALHVAGGVTWSTPDRAELAARVRLFRGVQGVLR